MKLYGPYITLSRPQQPRRFVIIVSDDGTRKSTPYARYLMAQHLGRELTDMETVDHIDGDCLNDDIANLQLMTIGDNIRKSAPPIEMVEFDCPVCGCRATKPARHVRHSKKQGKAGPFCGRRCARTHQVRVAQLA